MKYAKPEVVVSGSALSLIQGLGTSKGNLAPDVFIEPLGDPNCSSDAYEADE